MLDSYGKDYYGKTIDEYRQKFAHYQELIKQLEIAKNSANATESQIDFLEFQISEIEEANIKLVFVTHNIPSNIEIINPESISLCLNYIKYF